MSCEKCDAGGYGGACICAAFPDEYGILPNGLKDNYLVQHRGAILVTGLTRAGAENFIARHKMLTPLSKAEGRS